MKPLLFFALGLELHRCSFYSPPILIRLLLVPSSSVVRLNNGQQSDINRTTIEEKPKVLPCCIEGSTAF